MDLTHCAKDNFLVKSTNWIDPKNALYQTCQLANNFCTAQLAQ